MFLSIHINFIITNINHLVKEILHFLLLKFYSHLYYILVEIIVDKNYLLNYFLIIMQIFRVFLIIIKKIKRLYQL